MTEQWQELKETIIEMRDNNGTGTQQEVCKFLVNYMDVLEKQMGFDAEKKSIPYLMHKEMDIPISECQKAYNVAMEYLKSQAKVESEE